MPPKVKMTKDKETENESATDGVTETGGISAILDLLRIIQKDMDELKEENRIIKSQLVSHQEPIKLTELQQVMSQQTAVTVEDSKSESLSTENGQAKVKKALPNVKNLTITLNEDNWDDWNFEFRATLLLVDAVDVICGAKLTSSLAQTELFQWIYFVIVRSVNSRFRSMIQPVKVGDARAVYQLLFKHFVGDSEAKKSSLNEQFDNMTLDKAQNFPLYAQQISNIADKLNDLGETVTEQRKRRTLLKGLKGRKYAVIRASIDF